MAYSGRRVRSRYILTTPAAGWRSTAGRIAGRRGTGKGRGRMSGRACQVSISNMLSRPRDAKHTCAFILKKQSTTQRTFINPVDTKALLTDIYDAEAKFLDTANYVNCYDVKDKTTYQGKYIVWLIKNGYPPTWQEHRIIPAKTISNYSRTGRAITL